MDYGCGWELPLLLWKQVFISWKGKGLGSYGDDGQMVMIAT